MTAGRRGSTARSARPRARRSRSRRRSSRRRATSAAPCRCCGIAVSRISRSRNGETIPRPAETAISASTVTQPPAIGREQAGDPLSSPRPVRGRSSTSMRVASDRLRAQRFSPSAKPSPAPAASSSTPATAPATAGHAQRPAAWRLGALARGARARARRRARRAARAPGRLVVGLHEPARAAVSTISAGPERSTATTGSPQAIASTSTWPNCSRDGGQDEHVAAREEARQLVVVVPAGEEDAAAPVARTTSHGCSPSHSPGCPPTSTSAAPGTPARPAKARMSSAEALDRREAPDGQQRPGRREASTSAGVVGDAARAVAGPPAARLSTRCAAPEGAAVDRAGREELGIEAVGDARRSAPGSTPSSATARSTRARREQQQPPAALRPAAHPPRPCGGVRPAGRRPAGDLLEHQQLGPVQVPDDGHAGSDARGGLVQRGQVVQVQDVGPGGAGALQGRRPGGDVQLVGRVVDGREARVRGAGPVLEGGVHRRVAGAEVDGDHVQARVEVLGVAVARRQRAGHHRHVPPVSGSASARARATCEDPPRGKNISPLTTRRCTTVQSSRGVRPARDAAGPALARREDQRGRDRAAAAELVAVRLARHVDAAARRRPATSSRRRRG